MWPELVIERERETLGFKLSSPREFVTWCRPVMVVSRRLAQRDREGPETAASSPLKDL